MAPPSWHLRPLVDVCIRVTSGGTPSRKNPAYFLDGVWPWAKTQELRDTWIADTEEHITDEAVANSSAKVLPECTLLVAMYGATVGQLGILRRPMTCNQACCALLVDPTKADHRFVHYQLLHARSQLKGLATGAAQQNLSGKLIRSLRFPFPSVAEQRAIAHVLGTLDDKIELDRRMSETLEAMARALFKSWFVDFEPVRAEIDGRAAPHAAWYSRDVAPPAIGPEGIPIGWSTLPLNEVADFLNGLAMQRHPAVDADRSLPVIKIAELRNGVTAKTTRASHDVPREYVVNNGDFLFSWSGSLMAKFWTGGAGALNQHLFKVTSQRYPTWFFSQWILHHLPGFRAIAASKATTMGHIQRRHLAEAMAVCPSADVLAALDPTMTALLDHSINNDLESRTLASIRDALLPKLVSGGIRVPQAEKVVTAVL